MLNDSLIHELSSQLVPVRRRNVAREASWLAALGALELAIFLGMGTMRSDMAQALGHPFMWWKLGSLAVLAAVSFVTALRSFSPTVSPRRGLGWMAGLVALTAVVGAFVDPGLAEPTTLAGRLSPMHGMGCAVAIIVLSLPMLGMLTMLMRRGASTHAEGSALAVGVAGGSWGALVFSVCCPANDPLYVFIWYSAGCLAIALAARAFLPRYARL